MQFEKHFNRSKIFLLHFHDAYISMYEKKSSAEILLFMQNKYLYRISSFYEKRVETAVD